MTTNIEKTIYLQDTNQDGVFDLHGGDRAYDQNGHILSVSQAIEFDSDLAVPFKVSENIKYAQAFLDQPAFLLQNKTGKPTQGFKNPLGGIVVLGVFALGAWFFTKEDEGVNPEEGDDFLIRRFEFPKAVISGSGDDDDAEAVEVEDETQQAEGETEPEKTKKAKDGLYKTLMGQADLHERMRNYRKAAEILFSLLTDYDLDYNEIRDIAQRIIKNYAQVIGERAYGNDVQILVQTILMTTKADMFEGTRLGIPIEIIVQQTEPGITHTARIISESGYHHVAVELQQELEELGYAITLPDRNPETNYRTSAEFIRAKEFKKLPPGIQQLFRDIAELNETPENKVLAQEIVDKFLRDDYGAQSFPRMQFRDGGFFLDLYAFLDAFEQLHSPEEIVLFINDLIFKIGLSLNPDVLQAMDVFKTRGLKHAKKIENPEFRAEAIESMTPISSMNLNELFGKMVFRKDVGTEEN